MLCSECFERSCAVLPTKLNVCLKHLVAKSEEEKAGVFIFSHEEIQRQTDGVKVLWNDAIADVVLRMFALQKVEEETIRRDPLSVLGMNRNSHKKVLQQQFGDSGLLQTKATEDKGPAICEKGTAGARKRPLSGGLESMLSSSSSSELKAQMDEIEKRARANADGDPCRICGSKFTATSHTGNYDIGKSEVWGSKDSADTIMITCKDCHHREIVKLH